MGYISRVGDYQRECNSHWEDDCSRDGGMVALLGSPKNCEYPSDGEGCHLDPYI